MWVGCLQQRGGGPSLPPSSLQDVAGEVSGEEKGEGREGRGTCHRGQGGHLSFGGRSLQCVGVCCWEVDCVPELVVCAYVLERD